MSVPYLDVLYEYNYWAHHRILDTAAHLTEEQRQEPVFRIGSLHQTLVHTLAAEWLWRQRIQLSVSPPTLPQVADLPTFDALLARWAEEEVAMRAFVAGLSDGDLLRPVSYRTMRGVEHRHPLWLLLAHVVNHGTQHRSEAAAMLTELGHSPGDLDLIYYGRQKLG